MIERKKDREKEKRDKQTKRKMERKKSRCRRTNLTKIKEQKEMFATNLK